jgi:hypothetical protein
VAAAPFPVTARRVVRGRGGWIVTALAPLPPGFLPWVAFGIASDDLAQAVPSALAAPVISR